MDAPQIQYCKTSDGVNIAYAVFGEGLPLVLTSGVFGGLHMATHSSRSREPVERLVARGWKAILYDGRGSGSSDRECDDFSLEAQLRDLEAVVERVAASDAFALVGTLAAGPVAIAYTAQNPERVSHLVLRNAFATGADRNRTTLGMMVANALRPIAEEHWEFYTLTMSHAMAGYADTDRASEQASAFRTGMSPQAYLAISKAMDGIDVEDLLESVRAPTLVVNDTSIVGVGTIWAPPARKLASRIPNARMMVTDDYPGTVDQFLREGQEPSAQPDQPPSGTAIILFLDIAGSTELTTRLGDSAYREQERELNGALRQAIREAGGSPVEGKVLGDGVMATFGSAREAIEAAIACQTIGEGVRLALHAGIHAGDVTREGNNVHGGAVQVAARIADASAAGEVLVSDVVRGLARTSAGVSFEDRGERELKGVSEPVRVFEVHWRETHD